METKENVVSKIEFKCRFEDKGCKKRFSNIAVCTNHELVCKFGFMRTCKISPCDFTVFESNQDLVNHAAEVHNCILASPNQEPTTKLVLTESLLNPPNGGYVNFIMREFAFGMDKGCVQVAIVVMAKYGDPNLLLVPVKYGQANDHVVSMEIEVTGRSKISIPHAGTPLSLDLSPLRRRRLDGPQVCVDAFESDEYWSKFCHDNPELMIPRYDKNMLRKLAFMDRETGDPAVYVALKAFVTRCVIKRDERANLTKFANQWEDLGLDETVRCTMTEFGQPRAAVFSRIIIPQLQSNTDVIIESTDEQSAMNAVITGIMNRLVEVVPEESGYCKALVLLPSDRSMEEQFQVWSNRAKKCDLTVIKLKHSNLKSISHAIQRGEGDIVLTTPSYFAEAMRSDQYLWEVLMERLDFWHLHYPDGLTWAKTICIICEAVSRLGKKIKRIKKTAYGEVVSYELVAYLRRMIFRDPFIHLSLGPSPYISVAQLKKRIQVSRVNSDQEAADKMLSIITMDPNSWRWLVLVQKTDIAHLKHIRDVFSRNFDLTDKRFTFYTSDVAVRDDPGKFFKNFTEVSNAIMVAPYFGLDYHEYFKFADGLILYDRTYQQADLYRVAKLTERADNSFKPVHGLSRNEIPVENCPNDQDV